MKLVRGFVFAAIVLLSSCATSPPPPHAVAQPLVILVSIDGFRPADLNEAVTPTLARLAREGVRAEAMRPSFPSLTFPNHYTIVTGLRPDRHGILNNQIEDPDHPGLVFTLRDAAVNTQSFWWNDAAPIWVTAEQQGVRTATMFWPGSEAEIRGVRPSDWARFDQSLPSIARVDLALAWLDRPAAERPRFLTLYFDVVDTAEHRYGPGSAEAIGASRDVDAAMAFLMAGLAARGLAESTNIVVVSDHGMAQVAADRVVNLDEVVPAASVRYSWPAGPIAGIEPLPGHEAEAAALVGRHEHAECWARGAYPERFHAGTHRRTPAVLCMADVGWTLISAGSPRSYAISGGAHGYDPDDPTMAATFIAHGPAFRAGVTLPAFDNVDVYPLLADLLGVTPEPSDGSAAVFEPALAH